MKIKQDFVTNSSSSSFIMCLPKNPKKEDILKLNPLSKNQKLYAYNNPYSSSQIANTFLENFKSASKQTKEELYENIKDMSVYQNVFKLPKYKEPREMLDKIQQQMCLDHNGSAGHYFHLDYYEEQELLKDLLPDHYKKIEECFNKWWDRQLHKNIYSIELENHDYEDLEFGKDSDIIVLSNH